MIRPIKAILVRNLIKLLRDRMRLFFNLLMPGLLLFIFSFVIRSTAPGIDHPMNYLFSGIIIMTVFQTSLNNSMNILEDISTGFMKEILVAPIARWQIAIGQILSSTVVSVIQGTILIIAATIMGLRIDIIHGLAMILLMFLVGFTFSAIGLYLATIAKESSNFQLLIMVVTFPLTFLSGAYIPTMVLPRFLMLVVYINPLTYATAVFRFVVLEMENMPLADIIKVGVAFNINGFVITPLISGLIIITMCAIFFSLCVKRFNTADFSRVKILKRERH